MCQVRKQVCQHFDTEASGPQEGTAGTTPTAAEQGSRPGNPSQAVGKFRTRCYLQHFNDCYSVSLPRRSSGDARTFCALRAPKSGVNDLTRVSGFSVLNNRNDHESGISLAVHTAAFNNNNGKLFLVLRGSRNFQGADI